MVNVQQLSPEEWNLPNRAILTHLTDIYFQPQIIL